MNFQNSVVWFSWFLLALCTVSKQGWCDDRPNIVWLVSEDNSMHYLRLFDENGVETSNIERLATSGFVFQRAFSNAPVCSVARTTLMTGCYAPKLGAQFHRRIKPAQSVVNMFPVFLRSAGYHTSNNSKKDYNVVESENMWDESSRQATWRGRKKGQPFFHMRNFGQSHEGNLHFGLEEFQAFRRQESLAKMFVMPYHPKTELFRYTNWRYRNQIQKMDAKIGRVLDQLESDQLLDDTIVFYFSDHGGVLPRSKGYLYESGLHIPLVIHVPEKFRSLVPKAIRSTRRNQQFVDFVDFGPTVLKLAGIEPPAEMDGSPFLGPNVDPTSKDASLGYADRFDEKFDLVRSLRRGHFKYIRNFQPTNFDGMQNRYRYQMAAYRQYRQMYQDGQLDDVQRQFFEPKPAEMLFDLNSDPHETQNLSGSEAIQDVLVSLRQHLNGMLKSMPDTGFYPESVLVEMAMDDPVGFGKRNQAEIADLIDIANLQLRPIEEAKSKLATELNSDNPWRKYWAINSCIALGQKTVELSDRLSKIAHHDPNPLVAVAAAQYLGMVGQEDPTTLIIRRLRSTDNRIELAMMLNRVVLLADKYDYQFELKQSWFKKKNDNVNLLLNYLNRDK